MTFKQYYSEIIKQLKKTGDKKPSEKYIRIFWEYAYTIDQSVNSIRLGEIKILL